jgi:hypothetical protein
MWGLIMNYNTMTKCSSPMIITAISNNTKKNKNNTDNSFRFAVKTDRPVKVFNKK